MYIQDAQATSRRAVSRRHSFDILRSRYDISSCSLLKIQACTQGFIDCELYQAYRDSELANTWSWREIKNPPALRAGGFSAIFLISYRTLAGSFRTRNSKLNQCLQNRLASWQRWRHRWHPTTTRKRSIHSSTAGRRQTKPDHREISWRVHCRRFAEPFRGNSCHWLRKARTREEPAISSKSA